MNGRNEERWYSKDASVVMESMKARKEGLNQSEVEHRREEHGLNALPEKAMDPWWKLLLRQFLGPMILVLIVAAIVSALLHEWVDVGVILAAVVLNTAIGFIQEFKANKALEQLRSLVQPLAVVLRDGKEVEIPARELVPGDLLVLHTGDRVTADARLIDLVDMQVNESALTGESFPVKKQVERLEPSTMMADRSNMVYTGTSIVAGRGHAVVVATGEETQLGRVAAMVQNEEETKTPLQEQLSRMARWIAGIILVLVAVLFVLGWRAGSTIFEMFEMSVALAVAAVPEGLVVSVTVVLAIGMQRILKRQALVRRLLAAETLGSVSVICSDKTGTITEGNMRVTHARTFDHEWTFPLQRRATKKSLHDLLDVMALCNDATVLEEGGELLVKGSPTERALMRAVLEQGMSPRALQHEHPRTAEIPFDSAHKYMVTAHVWDSSTRILAKGAPGKIYEFCSKIMVNGRQVSLTQSRMAELREKELDLTKRGVRLIAIATKQQRQAVNTLEKGAQKNFVFQGFIGLHDPLRTEAASQIQAAKRAGVRTVMVTGDHPETARAIGKEAGLIVHDTLVITGNELDELSDDELTQRVTDISIYARVEPRHKIRIVKAWQARGEVVAMTGDGVNDAPALKVADIGLAVGSGTEVAKQASDVVLLDNNLSSITSAIQEGRVMFDNIRKTTVYLLSGSFTEISLIGLSILFGLPLPLLPVQILWINLVADSFPNIGLTLEKAETDVMQIPPRPRGEGVMNREMAMIGLVIGGVTIVTLFAFYLFILSHGPDIAHAQTLMFAAVGIDTLIYVFAARSFRRTIFHANPFANGWLILGVGAGFLMMALALLHPTLQQALQLRPLSLLEWGVLLMMSIGKLFIIEVIKGGLLLKKRN